MSTHGRSGIGRWTVGSVADKVVRTGDTPILLVRSQRKAPSAEVRGIVLPLDGSELSAGAIPHAVAMAKALGIGIHVVHARSPLSTYYQASRYTPDVLLDQLEKAEETAAGYVQQVVQRLAAEGVNNAAGAHVTDDPGSAILAAAGQAGDQLVVMTTHGRSGVQRLVLGSVTDRVVRHSHGPVLVVRAKGRD
jgi:nucleotide-binding universal stress UspA family protein